MSSKRSLLSLNLPKDIIGHLMRKGYENVQNIRETSPEKLASDLGISLKQVESIVGICQTQATPTPSFQMSQTASALAQVSSKVETMCHPLDTVLKGGVTRGNMLEISGPPGSPKEKLLLEIVVSFAKANDGVLFFDCSNMTSASNLARFLTKASTSPLNLCRHVQYASISSLAELLVLSDQLPNILASQPKISLIVFGSLSFPFQGHDLSLSVKNAHLEKVKQSFSRLCATRHTTVVTTSQLATKMLNADGSRGTFDSGGKGVMLPQLGMSCVVDGKSWRVLVCPEDPTTGFLKLLSSPTHPPGYRPEMLERYSLKNENIM